jgi:hypothetical protein
MWPMIRLKGAETPFFGVDACAAGSRRLVQLEGSMRMDSSECTQTDVPERMVSCRLNQAD